METLQTLRSHASDEIRWGVLGLVGVVVLFAVLRLMGLSRFLVGPLCLLLGLGVLGWAGYELLQTVRLSQSGVRVEGRVVGFKTRYGGTTNEALVHNRRKAHRSPVFRYPISERGDSLTSRNSAPAFFFWLTYDLNQRVPVAYDPADPSRAQLLTWREYPGWLLVGFMGFFIAAAGVENLRPKRVRGKTGPGPP